MGQVGPFSHCPMILEIPFLTFLLLIQPGTIRILSLSKVFCVICALNCFLKVTQIFFLLSSFPDLTQLLFRYFPASGFSFLDVSLAECPLHVFILFLRWDILTSYKWSTESRKHEWQICDETNTIFQSWYVAEHKARGLPNESLSSTLALVPDKIILWYSESLVGDDL